jgi:hypothetical protein
MKHAILVWHGNSLSENRAGAKPSEDKSISAEGGEKEIGHFHFPFVIFRRSFWKKSGMQVWNANLECKSGMQIWNASSGTQVWNPKYGVLPKIAALPPPLRNAYGFPDLGIISL